MKILGHLFYTLVLATAIGCGMAATPAVAAKHATRPTPTPAATAPALQRGVNLSHWLQFGGRQPVVAADMAMIKSAGFDHVRIPFDPALLGWNPDAATPTLYWTALDQAVNLALQANLAVIIDFHAQEALRDRIETQSAVQTAFLDLWQQIASHYAARPVASLAFELLNEPQYYGSGGAARWDALQQQALWRVRQAAPGHLVLLSGTQGGSIAGLLTMAQIKDDNVRYLFHFYDSMLFTHLNAPWEPFLSGPAGMITNLIYPARNALRQVKVLPNADPTIAMAAVNQYVTENWGPRVIKQTLAQAQNWAAQRGVSLICNEFGVLRVGPDAMSRNAWLNDTRSALEGLGIGWSVWDYADVFGIATANPGWPTGDHSVVPADPLNPRRTFDPGILATLGLK